VIIGSIVAVVVVALVLLASPLLSIRTIDVEGVVYADPERVGEVVASLRGDAILTADLHGAEKALEEIAWVREARVSMHLPRRVSIQIDERDPIAFYRAVDGFNRVIDLEGRILDVIEGDASLFARADEVEKSWEIIDPFVAAWAAPTLPPPDVYAPGDWGPLSSFEWMAAQGRTWFDLCPVLT